MQCLVDEPQFPNSLSYRALSGIARSRMPGVKIHDPVETTEIGGAIDVWAVKQAVYEKYIDIANWGRIVHQDVNCLLSHIFVERLQLSPRERYDCFLQRFPGLLNRIKLKYVAEFLGISIYTLSRIRSSKIG